MRKIMLLLSHAIAIAVGFVVGVYALPILIAPDAPRNAEVESMLAASTFRGDFRRDLAGSDFLHWGDGAVSVGPDAVAFMGSLAPGPDYRLYLSPELVEDETQFWRVKAASVEIGPVRTFKNFIIPLPDSVDAAEYNTVVIWCESFSQFITAAKYR